MKSGNIIQRLQKISAKLFQESLKTFHFKDVIAHKKATPHHLIEFLSFYPNKGVGFHARRRIWPQGRKIHVTSTQFKSNRYGMARGMLYQNEKSLWDMPKRIPGSHLRGIWEYEIGDAKNVTLDNGLVYTPAEYKAYQQTHKSWAKPYDLSETHEEQVAEQFQQEIENEETEKQQSEQK